MKHKIRIKANVDVIMTVWVKEDYNGNKEIEEVDEVVEIKEINEWNEI